MNVTRICDLAHVLVMCRHESDIAVGDTTIRYCLSCGSLRSVNGLWLRPNVHDDLARALSDGLRYDLVRPAASASAPEQIYPWPRGLGRKPQ